VLISPRLASVFAAAIACASMPAGPAQATSAVEAARAHERDVAVTADTDEGQRPPESPLAIAAPLTLRESLQIQLGSPEPAARADTTLLELSLDVAQK
jgi:hypothetical protein